MLDKAAARIARARSLVGTRFRLQGRDRDGLDCVGLIAIAHGVSDGVPDDYAIRGADRLVAMDLLDRHFARRRKGPPQPGDIVLLALGITQLHLGIWTGAGLVHAHAGLRRVVETPGPLDHPIAGLWHQETD